MKIRGKPLPLRDLLIGQEFHFAEGHQQNQFSKSTAVTWKLIGKLPPDTFVLEQVAPSFPPSPNPQVTKENAGAVLVIRAK